MCKLTVCDLRIGGKERQIMSSDHSYSLTDLHGG